MSFVKYATLLSAITVSTAAVAEGSAKNLDLLGSLGFTQMSFADSNNFKANGYNLGASALFAISDTAVGSPVAGGGLNFAHISKDDFSLFKLALLGHVGFKFKPTNELAIFALGNVGYNPVLFSKNKNSSSGSINFNFQNYSYGASLIATYKVMPEISVGAGAIYNFNYYKNTANAELRFNELSANVYVAYSL